MSRKHFGTDGVRGIANTGLTAEFALQLGNAVGHWLRGSGQAAKVIIGRDTRRSGNMLEAALTAGLTSMGIEVYSLGVAPTPAVSFMARTGNFGLGVVISASHNPAPDNGIKFLTGEGTKSSDALEAEWERLMEAQSEWLAASRGTGAAVGTAHQYAEGLKAYRDFLVAIVPERLDGMKVAVDAAHGAAYEIGPEVLRALGAEIVTTGVTPDGMNINAEGGATRPQTVQDLTVEARADVGVAFDGDADRAIFSDEKGRLINGDRTIGIWATHRKSRGELDPSVVVGTVMSNGGFSAYLDQQGIGLERTSVGDKYVSQRIAETGAHVGGEQSGHIIFPERGPTGDGLVTMLELLRVLKQSGRSAATFFDDYEPWAQLMVNVAVASKDGWQTKIAPEMEASERALEGRGRVLVRASGTQPMIRVMVEADEVALRDREVDRLVEALCEKAGGTVHGRVDLTHALGD